MSSGTRIETPNISLSSDPLGDVTRFSKRVFLDNPLNSIQDLTYSIGSGNYNSALGSVFGGEGSRARAGREANDKVTALEAQDAQVKADEVKKKQNQRIDSYGKTRASTPGRSQTLLSANYGASPSILLTPKGG